MEVAKAVGVLLQFNSKLDHKVLKVFNPFKYSTGFGILSDISVLGAGMGLLTIDGGGEGSGAGCLRSVPSSVFYMSISH